MRRTAALRGKRNHRHTRAHTEQMLEVLAGVRPCREKPFTALSDLLLTHAASLSGCIGVFLDWDEPRRLLVQRLKALGLPMLILIVTDRTEADLLDRIPPPDRPERLHILETGRIAEGLQRL